MHEWYLYIIIASPLTSHYEAAYRSRSITANVVQKVAYRLYVWILSVFLLNADEHDSRW